MADCNFKDYMASLVSNLETIVKRKFEFYRRVKGYKYSDGRNGRKVEPHMSEAGHMSFSLYGPQLHFKLDQFDHLREDTKEPIARLTLSFDQMTPNEVMDLLDQLTKAKIRRRILDPDGSNRFDD